MTDARDPRAIDPLDELRAELGRVTVSTEFEGRVRERVTYRVPGSRFRVPGSRFGFRFGAIAAALVMLLWSAWQLADRPVEYAAEAGHVRVAPVAPADVSRAARTVRPVRSTPRPTPPEPRTRNLEPGTRNLEPGTGNLEPGTGNLEPTLEVITNQPAILAALWAEASQPARVEVVAPAVPPVVEELAIASVEVSPVVVKWLVEPPVAGFTLPFIVRIAAEAVRRPE